MTCQGIGDAGGKLNGRGVYRTQGEGREAILHRKLAICYPGAVESQRFGLLHDLYVVQDWFALAYSE
jgi:hypothetical protein